MGFSFFIQETANILIRGICIGINGHIGHIFIDKTIDEIREVQLGFMESVEKLEILTISLIESCHCLFKVSVHFEWNVHLLLSPFF